MYLERPSDLAMSLFLIRVRQRPLADLKREAGLVPDRDRPRVGGIADHDLRAVLAEAYPADRARRIRSTNPRAARRRSRTNPKG